MRTILFIASQMIQRIELMHSMNFIHRDIKPENFLIGAGKKSNIVYCIDFGLSKRYRCPKTGQHIELKQRHGITGTPRYCSLNAHQSFEQSRRDDLESLGYIFVYFAKDGKLPWMKAEDPRGEKNTTKKELAIKNNTTLEELCEGLPDCFIQYMNYVRKLKFEQKPDYKMLRFLFEQTFAEMGYEVDNRWDWHIFREKTLEEKRKKEE